MEFLLSLLFAHAVIAQAPTHEIKEEQKKEEVLSPKTAVVNEFGENHIMYHIARCESGMRQFLPSGEVLRGHVNSKDVGIFQINEFYHLEASKRLGIDIYTLHGNIEYSKHLYKEEGTSPWNASKSCWNK